MDRVVITKPWQGMCHMQACAAKDATDEEILDVCNRENPSGTVNGWTHVLRADEEFMGKTGGAPVQCDDHQDRLHLLVSC
jgi:hypothetical protein